MPTYRIETSQGTFEVDANREPTEADVRALVESGQLKATAQATATQAKPAPVQNTFGRGGGLMITGLPQFMNRPLAEGGGAAAGAQLGAMTGPAAPVMIPVGAVAGAMLGNRLSQFMRGGEFSQGENVGAGIGGLIPGASLARQGVPAVMRAGAKFGAQNVAAMGAETIIDQKRLPTMREAATAGALGFISPAIGRYMDSRTRAKEMSKALGGSEYRRTLKSAKELGLVMPPSLLGAGEVSNAFESIAGKADMVQKAVRINEPATTNAVRQELGLPRQEGPGAKPEISVQEINTLNKAANKPFEAVAAVSPQSDALLKQYLETQDKVRLLEQANFRSYSTERLNEIRSLRAERDIWLNDLRAELRNTGNPELIDALQEARIFKAKIALADAARNRGTGAIDGAIIGNALDQGKKLTGNLEKIGRVHQAFGRVMKDAANSPAPGVSKLMPYIAGGAGGALAATGNPGAGAAAFMGTMMAPTAVRGAMLSRPYQNYIQSQQPFIPENFASSLARFATQSAGREPSENP